MCNRLFGLVVLALASSQCLAAAPRVFLLNGEALQQSRQKVAAGENKAALDRLRDEADDALKAKPLSVMDKKLTPSSGDKHDYMSVGPYWWPDPTKPDGLPYIQKDGQVNPERRKGDTDASSFGRTQGNIYVLAAAYYFTQDERYADKAATLLRVWFLDPKTRMNPNLNFGQAIPGRTEGRGVGIIDTTSLCDTVDAIGLLGGSKAWTAADQQSMVAWYAAYLDWLRTSKIGKDEEKAANNHGMWFDAQVACFALFAGKPEIAKEVLEAAKARRLDSQIKADGSQPHELKRTNSFSYTLFNLRAAFNLARLGEHVGVDLWNHTSKEGGGIRKAIDFVVPYADLSKPWPHKQIKPFKEPPLDLGTLLRRAAVAYKDSSYAELYQKHFAERASTGWRVLLH